MSLAPLRPRQSSSARRRFAHTLLARAPARAVAAGHVLAAHAAAAAGARRAPARRAADRRALGEPAGALLARASRPRSSASRSRSRSARAARRRRDARLLLIGLAFVVSAGFLGLHALATPGVIIDGKNAGFVLATPVGLVLAGCFAAASAVEYRLETSLRIVRHGAAAARARPVADRRLGRRLARRPAAAPRRRHAAGRRRAARRRRRGRRRRSTPTPRSPTSASTAAGAAGSRSRSPSRSRCSPRRWSSSCSR